MRILRCLLVLAGLQSFLQAATQDQIRVATTKAVSMIQKVNAQWKLPCLSCHYQTLGDMAIASARARGLAVNEKLALQSATKTYRRLLDLDSAVRINDLVDPVLSEGAMLSGAIAAGVTPNLVTTI